MSDMDVSAGAPPLRVFLSCADTYAGRHVGERLLKATYVERKRRAAAEEESGSADDASVDSVELPHRAIRVLGTACKHASDDHRMADGTEVVKAEDAVAVALTCDVVIVDTQNDPEEVIEMAEAFARASDSWDKERLFLCLSTVMTWAKTKVEQSADEINELEDEDIPGLTEDVYRTRKPHPDFRRHIYAEKVALDWSYKKPMMRSYVIARGLMYGAGEHIFHVLFKAAWNAFPRQLPCVGAAGIVPAIHVYDFASIVARIVQLRPSTRYVLAVDMSNDTMYNIVQCVSKNLGTSEAPRRVRHDDKWVKENYTSDEIEMQRADIRMEPGLIADEEFGLEWHAQYGMIENIHKVVDQFRVIRGLTPLKLFIHGPPAAGKTTLSQAVSREYKMNHIKTVDVIKEYLENLRNSPELEMEEVLLEIEENKVNGRYTDEQMVMFFKAKLRSMPCQNKGFVLDGFPKSKKQAEMLFLKDDEEEDVEEEEEEAPFIDICPEYVVLLECSDDFARTRVMALPEKDVAGTHNTREGVQRRLKAFRAANNDQVSVRDFFDEKGVTPLVLDAGSPVQANLDAVKKYMGKPHNYGPSKRDIEVQKKVRRERENLEAYERRAAFEAEERAELLKREAAEEEWMQRRKALRKEEETVLAAASEPLQHFLATYVMPTLAPALREVCRVRPDDPVDYLAEYLFKHNPVEDEESEED